MNSDQTIVESSTDRDCTRTRDTLIGLCLSGEIKPPLCWKLASIIESWLGQPDVAEFDEPLAPESKPRITRRQLRAACRVANRAHEIARACERSAERVDARIVTRLDHDYPAQLHDLEAPTQRADRQR